MDLETILAFVFGFFGLFFIIAFMGPGKTLSRPECTMHTWDYKKDKDLRGNIILGKMYCTKCGKLPRYDTSKSEDDMY